MIANRLDKVGGEKIAAKWKSFVDDLAQAGVSFDEEPDVFLGEIERA